MNKKFLLFIVTMLIAVLPAGAVLKEKNLENTLSILRGELTTTYQDLQKQAVIMEQGKQRIRQNMLDIYTRSSQNSLMLYSQKSDYIFDLTYACHEATEMYHNFKAQSAPFRNYIEKFDKDLNRYDSLIVALNNMPVMMLSDKAKVDRSVCLTFAVSIRRSIQETSEQMADHITMYKRTEERLRNLNDYANKRYSEIQSSIFVNGGDSYFAILKNISIQVKNTFSSVSNKYRPHQHKVRSQWDLKIVFFLFMVILIYGFASFVLNVLFIRFLMPKRLRTESFIQKRWCIILATSVITMAIILGILRLIISDQYFFVMASGLLVEYTWLLGVILISLLLRLNGDQIKSAFRIYSPLIVMGFIVILFRIVLIPNDLVNLVFPPILLINTLWQWNVIRRHNANIPKSDVYFAYITLAVFIVSCISSWIGYTLLSVQALIWWVMQLMCILTITFVARWMNKISIKKHHSEKPITQTWFFDLIRQVMLPVMGVASFITAIYWGSAVFNMSDTTWRLFTTNFVNNDNLHLSIYGLSMVIALYFVFAYFNRTTKALLALHFEKSDISTAASRNVLARNIVQIVIWGIYILVSLSMLHVSTTWIAVIGAGLSTGVGFASKDILENIYYGVSLMAGRVKIGDLIEVGDTRGVVSSISYTSTMLDIPDGSVIAYQNSQLFTQNYKNLTKNHGYELDKIDIGVAYGSDIDKVRTMLIENVSKLECLEEGKPVSVVFHDFADSCVSLKVCVWVPVLNYLACDGEVRECIYKTLNAHNVEIPFPQVDIHNR